MHGAAQDADRLYGPSLVMDKEESEELWDMEEEENEDEDTEDQEGPGTLRVVQGISCMIEYKKGDYRDFTTPGDFGSPMGYPVLADYGYILNTISSEEGEERDVFIGDDEDSQEVFVLQLRNPDDPPTLMEEKILLCMDCFETAREFSVRQYYPEMIENIYQMSLQDLKDLCEQEKTKAAALKQLSQNKAMDMARREAEEERLAEVSGYTGEHTEPFVIVTPDQL